MFQRQSLICYFILHVFLMVSPVFASDTVDIIIVTTSGEKKIQRVPADVTMWGFAQSDQSGYKILSIENLDELPNLERLELINIDGISDYSFLSKAKKLNRLHITGCLVQDLKFIEDLVLLQYLFLGIYPQNGFLQSIQNTSIDLSKLINIEFIGFSCQGHSGVPMFVNVKNKPFLDISNNQISTVSMVDVKLLSQYSLLNIRYNPIVDNPLELKKLHTINCICNNSDPIPENILRYYRGE
ncbi:hypothetical protein K7J14_03425 [Treponema zuelzerae]|uniref:Leucine-rich repeat domain-containing protein n=1 Tax=Teretinema zuelzerae TaxID=156 RepID=A0AAE3EH51_9SPIR|nr:hypothetical protein [Teretinema zuelzerae]MCD1653748.1 hypothetical protein [Teretinema zuelzerae]